MKKIRIIMTVLFVAILCFVWGNSLLSPELSVKISTAVGEFLAEIFGSGDGVSMAGGLSVRKVAHFVEFCALGAVTSLLLGALVSSWRIKLCIEAFVGLFVPVIDETIQIFSRRGSSLKDVWLDVAGYACGCAAVYLCLFLLEKIKNKSKNRP